MLASASVKNSRRMYPDNILRLHYLTMCGLGRHWGRLDVTASVSHVKDPYKYLWQEDF